MGYFNVKVEDNVAIVTLSSPPANALSSGVLKELSTVLDDLENSVDCNVILLQGEGRFFSAGADIKEFTKIESGSGFSELSTYGQKVFDRMETFQKPIIASIHGAALGGGLELAMACHIRLVSKNAKLGLPELTLGLIPGFAGTQRLPHYVGAAKAAEMLLTSEPITGEEAAQFGLANQAYSEEELFEKALDMSKKIAQKGKQSIRYTMELLFANKNQNIQEGQAKEAEYFGVVFESEDGKEGINAFIEKRKPTFSGH
jgi:enoyl-CoA hydratase